MSSNAKKEEATVSGRGPLMAYVGLVTLTALAAAATLPTTGLREHGVALATLLVLAGWVGSRAIQITRLRIQVTAGDAFMFCGMVLVGPLAAPLIALAGILGAIIGGRRTKAIRAVFNLGTMALAASCAARVHLVLSDVSSLGMASDSVGLLAAAVTYVLVNTLLVALVIHLERGTSMFSAWRSFVVMALNSTVASLLVGLGLYSLYTSLGPLGLLAGLAGSVMMGAAVQSFSDRMNAETATASSSD